MQLAGEAWPGREPRSAGPQPPTSAVLGLLEEEPEAGVLCKSLIKGTLSGDWGGRERLRRMRFQPETSHSLIPQWGVGGGSGA